MTRRQLTATCVAVLAGARGRRFGASAAGSVLLWVAAVAAVAAVGGCCWLIGPGGRAGVEPADNGFCFVCHMNYTDEPLAAGHAARGVGCMSCHGLSEDHMEDENHQTPPSVMFPRVHIAGGCLTCHQNRRVVRVAEHAEIMADPTGAAKTCTDCHGQTHRLAKRQVQWNKFTGELLPKE